MILVFGLAPILIDAAAALSVSREGTLAQRLTSGESTRPERFLDSLFGERSTSLAAVTAQASASTAYLRIASLSIALYE